MYKKHRIDSENSKDSKEISKEFELSNPDVITSPDIIIFNCKTKSGKVYKEYYTKFEYVIDVDMNEFYLKTNKKVTDKYKEKILNFLSKKKLFIKLFTMFNIPVYIYETDVKINDVQDIIRIDSELYYIKKDSDDFEIINETYIYVKNVLGEISEEFYLKTYKTYIDIICDIKSGLKMKKLDNFMINNLPVLSF